MWETWVWSLGQEDPLEKEIISYSSILAWKISWMEAPPRLQFMGLQRAGHDWMTSLFSFSTSVSMNQVVVQSLSHVPLFASPWIAACSASLSFTISQSVQVRVHCVSDAVQPSRPLPSSSPPPFSLSQLQGLSQWVSSSFRMAKVLALQHQFFQWIFRFDFIQDWLVWSPCCPRDSQIFSSTTIQKHQFSRAQPSLWSNSHFCTWLLEKPWLWLYGPLSAKWCLYLLIHCLGLS